MISFPSRHLARFVIGLFTTLLAPPVWASKLARDEQVLFVPGTARSIDKGELEVSIEAWVHEKESRPGATRLFARYLGLDPTRMTATEHMLFEQRTQLFRVDSESGKNLQLRFADGTLRALPRTMSGGRTSTRLRVPARPGDDRWLHFTVANAPSDASRFEGAALVVPAHGVSVISDIDDTIKLSQVRDRHTLLLNTFTRAFEAVPGMAERYRELGAGNDAMRFHYVSSSPLQLYPPIADFLRDAGFPAGSVHLRETTSVRAIVTGDGSRRHKHAAIERLLTDFPQRRFVLVGDSGEADPEIYAEVARRHPQQVIAIAIRNVSDETVEAARYVQTYKGIPRERWDVFDDPHQWRWQPPHNE